MNWVAGVYVSYVGMGKYYMCLRSCASARARYGPICVHDYGGKPTVSVSITESEESGGGNLLGHCLFGPCLGPALLCRLQVSVTVVTVTMKIPHESRSMELFASAYIMVMVLSNITIGVEEDPVGREELSSIDAVGDGIKCVALPPPGYTGTESELSLLRSVGVEI